jgi:hypothetical protein
MSYATKPPRQVAPVRIMNGQQLAAVVTSEGGQVTIRPEADWELETATINVTMRKRRKPRAKKEATP